MRLLALRRGACWRWRSSVVATIGIDSVRASSTANTVPEALEETRLWRGRAEAAAKRSTELSRHAMMSHKVEVACSKHHNRCCSVLHKGGLQLEARRRDPAVCARAWRPMRNTKTSKTGARREPGASDHGRCSYNGQNVLKA